MGVTFDYSDTRGGPVEKNACQILLEKRSSSLSTNQGKGGEGGKREERGNKK